MSPIQERYVNPLTDYGFKRIFGEEPNKDILMAFLTDILPDSPQITDLQYLKGEQLGRTGLDRKAVFDLYCSTSTGKRFIVELQKVKQNFFKDRSVYYSSFPIQDQGKRGDWNFKLDAVYTVGILDFVFDDHKEEEELYHLVELKNQRNEVFYDKLKYVYVELPKFTKTADELESRRDKWLYVFRHLSNLNDRPAALRDRIFERLFAVAEIAKFSREELASYEDSLKYYRDLKNSIDTSYEDGREEGRLEGREEGIQLGVERVARRLLEQGLPVENVAAATGLSIASIKQLKSY